MELKSSCTTSQYYLSDALNYSSFSKGSLNLIVAPCGSGKTTAAFTTIPNYLHVPPQRCLILVSTVAAVEEFVNDDFAHKFNFVGKEWDQDILPETDKPTIMTYALFGAQYKKRNLSLEDYDYIVCDEIHSLNQSIAMSRAKLIKNYPQATTWEINDMLQMTCFTYIAIETIEKAIKQQNAWVFALTATPAQLYKNYLQSLSAMINEVQFSQKLHAYEIFCKFEYSEIEPILRAVIPENRKRLFYFHTIKELTHYKQILLDCGRQAEAIWSTNSEKPMTDHMKTTRDCILEEHRFPDDVQDLLINSAYELAINIKDPLVKEAYIHTGNKDTREQARSRLRQDLEVVGYYNLNAKKDANKAEKKHKRILECIAHIPETYFDRELTVSDKNELLATLLCPCKWPTFKKALIEVGYEVIEIKSDAKRYSVIRKKE